MTTLLSTAILVLFAVVTFTDACSIWKKDMAWCFHSGSEVHVGDFNGDSIKDMLCHDRSGHKWIALADRHRSFSGTSWHSPMGWCYKDHDGLHIGEFNGDGRSDMLCHNSKTGHIWIAYANAKGNFDAGTGWHSESGWCNHSGAQLFIGDFNGDGRDDLMCHDTSGKKYISHADQHGAFKGTSWSLSGWCGHNGAELYLGDFNGDSHTDMLCHDSSGSKWIAFASCDGVYSGTNWKKLAMGWCSNSGENLHVADFNGDGRDDMLCHDGAGRIWIAYSNVEGNFKDGIGWSVSMKWCYHSQEKLFVGDFDGDNHSDMLCHDIGDGYKWIAFANLTGTFE